MTLWQTVAMVSQFPNSDIQNLPVSDASTVNTAQSTAQDSLNGTSSSSGDGLGGEPNSASDDGALDSFVPVTTDEGKLQQLIDWLEEHVSVYSYIGETAPLGGTAEEIQQARESVNNRGARFPDAIVHGSMMVLGAAVNHSSPYLAYANGTVDVLDTTVGVTTAGAATGDSTPIKSIGIEGKRPGKSAFTSDSSCESRENVPEESSAGYSIPVRIFTPDSPTGAVVVAAHGGGFWMGDGALRDNAFAPDMAALSARSGAVVVDVDYRLAPENKVDAASDDIVSVIQAVLDGSLGLHELGAHPIGKDNPLILYGVSSGGHNVVRAFDKISAKRPLSESSAVEASTERLSDTDVPIALLLVSPALDLRGLAEDWLEAFFGTTDATSREVSPGLYAPSRALRVHVQSASMDSVVKPATEYLQKVKESGGEVSEREFLATHQIAMPITQRERITDAARFILEVTHTERALDDDPSGEYDKEAVDRQNEESWGQ